MNNLQQAKINTTLDTKVRYREGIMTRREWLNLMKSKGATVEESTKARIMFNRTKYNRMTGKEQEEYERKTNERVICYNLQPAAVSSYFEITKTEYNYFITL